MLFNHRPALVIGTVLACENVGRITGRMYRHRLHVCCVVMVIIEGCCSGATHIRTMGVLLERRKPEWFILLEIEATAAFIGGDSDDLEFGCAALIRRHLGVCYREASIS